MYPHIEQAMRRVPTLAQHRHQAVVLRPGVLHARSQLPHGRGAESQELLRRCGLQFAGHPLGRRRRPRDGALDRRWACARWTSGRWISAALHAWQNNARYLLDRTVESLGIGYQDHWPFRQWQSARDVKKSILHDRLEAAGACFGESAGWERPNWYARPGQAARYEYGWGRQNWFANNAEEHRAVRERVGLFEQSSFAKLLVQGRDAESVLNRIATASVSVAAGRESSTRSS